MDCMKRFLAITAFLALCTAGTDAGKPRVYIRWAKSWIDAVAEVLPWHPWYRIRR